MRTDCARVFPTTQFHCAWFWQFSANARAMHMHVKQRITQCHVPAACARVRRCVLPCRSLIAGAMVSHKLFARILAFIALFHAHGCLKSAAAYYEAHCNLLLPPEKRVKAPKPFIAYQKKKLLDTGSLDDRARSGRKSKIPKGVLTQCCEALKGGYLSMEQAARAFGYRQWASIKDAVYGPNCHPFLAQVCLQFGVTPQLLQRRLHRHDPNLVHKQLHFKKPLTIEQQLVRQSVASQLLACSLASPGLLLRAFWMDECSITFSSGAISKVKVYCDKRSHAAQATHPTYTNMPGTRYRTITVHCIAAVNALTGAVYLEFTTGTTDIQRRHLPNITYKVSAQHCQTRQHVSRWQYLPPTGSCCACAVTPSASNSRSSCWM